jgi:hypothetical protein
MIHNQTSHVVDFRLPGQSAPGPHTYTLRRKPTMQIRRVTTAEAPVGVITQIDEIFDPSTVETGIDVLDIWGFDKVPELPVRPEHVLSHGRQPGDPHDPHA